MAKCMHVFERQKWTFLNSDLMQNCLRRPYKIQGSDYIKGSLYVRGNSSTVSLLEMPCRPKFDKNSELYFDECIKANKVLLNRFQKWSGAKQNFVHWIPLTSWNHIMRTDQYWTPSSTLEVTEEVTELDTCTKYQYKIGMLDWTTPQY